VRAASSPAAIEFDAARIAGTRPDGTLTDGTVRVERFRR